MKYSALACKDLTDVVRETAVLHEYNAKVRQPDRQCGTGATTLIGSFLKATGKILVTFLSFYGCQCEFVKKRKK